MVIGGEACKSEDKRRDKQSKGNETIALEASCGRPPGICFFWIPTQSEIAWSNGRMPTVASLDDA